MFGIKEFFWIKDETQKTELKGDNIKAFNTAIYAIKDFIDFKDWQRASLWIKEIRDKEQSNLDKKLEGLDTDSKESKEEIAKVTEKFNTLSRLEVKLKKEKEKYEKYLEEKRYRARLEIVHEKTWIYIHRWEFEKAADELNTFLSDFPWDDKVIKYVTKKKKEIARFEKIKDSAKKSIFEETKDLVWESLDLEEHIEEWNLEEKESFKDKIQKLLSIMSERKKKIEEKKLLDEISIIMKERWENVDNDVKDKLKNIHKWLSKEIRWVSMVWYDFFWKIMWADKISWDTFWFKETKDYYRFFLWDATGHWVKAGLMISLMSNKFEELGNKLDFKEAVKEINNSLKQELKSWNFVTSIFYQVEKADHKHINFIWMWHEPMFIFRAETREIEKVIPGWIAAWIRISASENSVKTKRLDLNHWDIAMAYSDWIAEAKSPTWEYYGFERLKHSFKLAAQKHKEPKKVYEQMIEDVKEFHEWTKFNDDLTIILMRRNEERDVISDNEKIKDIMNEFWLDKNVAKKYKWKSMTEIKKEIEKDRKEKELKAITKGLRDIYMTWDFLKLKQESIRFIKEWYIHKDINYFLKKANENEFNQKIKIKNERLTNKYNILKGLYDKWDYDLVMKECEEIITKDWNI